MYTYKTFKELFSNRTAKQDKILACLPFVAGDLFLRSCLNILAIISDDADKSFIVDFTCF